MSLTPVDATNEVAVVDYLTKARDWLHTAVDLTGPEQIAAAKAEIATAAEATKQLNLSKEIQLDAQEMVRRAEYALGKAIRKGQDEGTIRRHGQGSRDRDRELQGQTTKLPPTGFAKAHELTGIHGAGGIYDMADADPEEFDAALDEAKAEDNLSRANVVRKVKKQKPKVTADDRAIEIADLASRGYSSRQIAETVGIRDDVVRKIARDYDIDIHADQTMSRTRKHDSNAIVANTVAALEGLAMGVGLVNYGDLDPSEKADWADSLKDSLKVLNTLAREIKKESTQ